jgi:hypothetical protein
MWYLTRSTGIVAGGAGGGVAGVGPVLLRSQHRHPAEAELVAGTAQLPRWPHPRVRRPPHAGVVPRHRRGAAPSSTCSWPSGAVGWADRLGRRGVLAVRRSSCCPRSPASAVACRATLWHAVHLLASPRRRAHRGARLPGRQRLDLRLLHPRPRRCSIGIAALSPSPSASSGIAAAPPSSTLSLAVGETLESRHHGHPPHSPEPRPIDPLLQQRRAAQLGGSPGRLALTASVASVAGAHGAATRCATRHRRRSTHCRIGRGQRAPARRRRRRRPVAGPNPPAAAKLVLAGPQCRHPPSGWPACSRKQNADNVDSIQLTDRHLRPTR